MESDSLHKTQLLSSEQFLPCDNNSVNEFEMELFNLFSLHTFQTDLNIFPQFVLTSLIVFFPTP